MEQTSKLGIVVDTRNAQAQLQRFSTALKQVERDGIKANKSLFPVSTGINRMTIQIPNPGTAVPRKHGD